MLNRHGRDRTPRRHCTVALLLLSYANQTVLLVSHFGHQVVVAYRSRCGDEDGGSRDRRICHSWTRYAVIKAEQSDFRVPLSSSPVVWGENIEGALSCIKGVAIATIDYIMLSIGNQVGYVIPLGGWCSVWRIRQVGNIQSCCAQVSVRKWFRRTKLWAVSIGSDWRRG